MKLYIINPSKGGASYKKTGVSKMTRRRKRRSARRKRSYRKNPYLMNGRKRRRKSYRRNPVSLKKAFNKNTMINIVSLGVGFVGGLKAQKFINEVEFLIPHRKYTGAIPLVLGILIGVKGKKEAVKAVASGLSLSGLYDLVSQNFPDVGLAPIEGVDLDNSMYNMNYGGATIDVNGATIDVDGMDDDLVGEDESEAGHPYVVI